MEELKLSIAVSSSSWKASSPSPSGMNSWASSSVWRNPVSVFSIDVRSLSRSLVLIILTSAGSSDLIALILSAALVIAPRKQDLDFLMAAISVGVFLLELIAVERTRMG